MSATLAELIEARPAEEVKAELLSLLQSEDFAVTDWHEGGVERTLVEIDTTVLAAVETTVADVAKGGHLDTSSGGWLTLYAKGRYGLDRRLASFAVHQIVLSDVASSGPHTITAGQYWFANSAGLRFTNANGGTLAAGGTLTLQAKAESPGDDYNVGLGTITTMLTPLPGVTVTNTDYASSGSSLIESGTDEETDAALRQRCRDRWSELGPGATAASYRNWALAADTEVTRVLATADVADDGTVNVMIAGASGALSGGVVTAVQDYIDERVPLTVEAVVASVTNHTVTLTGTVYVSAAYAAAAEAEGEALLEELGRECPIGGTDVGGGTTGISKAEIIERLMSPTGVRNVILSSPASDVALTGTQVPVFDVSGLTWTAV